MGGKKIKDLEIDSNIDGKEVIVSSDTSDGSVSKNIQVDKLGEYFTGRSEEHTSELQ